MKRVPLVAIIRVEITLETPVTQEIQEILEARLSRNLQPSPLVKAITVPEAQVITADPQEDTMITFMMELL